MPRLFYFLRASVNVFWFNAIDAWWW